jgi:hypothetical protein
MREGNKRSKKVANMQRGGAFTSGSHYNACHQLLRAGKKSGRKRLAGTNGTACDGSQLFFTQFFRIFL